MKLLKRTFVALALTLLAGAGVAEIIGIPENRGADCIACQEGAVRECVAPAAAEPVFTISVIPDSIFARMQGRSYKVGARITRAELRYLRLSHYDMQGHVRVGEMVCNRRVAQELVDIFRELYRAKYPIERMQLVDDYDADDERSMRANNTSCFNYRTVAGSKTLSAHSRGMAVDINPLYNPCVRTRNGKRSIEPATATQYADRTRSFTAKIDTQDLAYRLFTQHGYRWGGAWRTVKDYQHFEK